MSFSPALSRQSSRQTGFTLVELLSAMVVLAILGLIIAQAFLATSKVLTSSNKDTDSYSDMRQALDRIGLDLAARIKREDVPLYFQKNNGNDTFSFFSAVASTASAASNPRGLSQLFYRVGTTGANAYSLQRASEGVLWAGGGTAPLIFVAPGSTLVPPTTPVDADFDMLAPSVFRLEVSYISASSSPGNILNTFPTTAGAWQTEVGSVCITLAALDGDSRKLLTSPATQLANLALKLVDATDGQDLLGTWNTVVQNSPALATAAGIPPEVATRIRVMERRFPIN